jgi:small-conductance mechanosensitive channel
MFPYVDSYRYDWIVPDRIYRGIVRRFAAEGIEIPVPITNVHIKRDTLPAAIVVTAQAQHADRQ